MNTGEYEAFVLPAYPLRERSGSGVAKRATVGSPFPSDNSSPDHPSGSRASGEAHSSSRSSSSRRSNVPAAPDSMAGVTSARGDESSRASVIKSKPNPWRSVIFIASGAAVGILVAMVARQRLTQTADSGSLGQRASGALGLTAAEAPAPPRVEAARISRGQAPPPVSQIQAPQGAAPGVANAAPVPPVQQVPPGMQLVQTPQGPVLIPVPRNPVAVAGGIELKAPPAAPKPHAAPRYTPQARRAAAAPAARAASPAAAPAAAPASQDVVEKGRSMADEAL